MPRAISNTLAPHNRIVQNDVIKLPPALATDLKLHARSAASEGSLNDPGITFNEAGVTFNQAGVTFGGFYGFTDAIAGANLVKTETPRNQKIIDLPGTATPIPTGGGNAFGPGFFMFIPQ